MGRSNSCCDARYANQGEKLLAIVVTARRPTKRPARQAILREAEMIIIPGRPALQETRHSREMSRRVDDAIREYRREHPDATEADVRTALVQSAPSDDSPFVERRKRFAAVGVAAALVGAFTAVSSSGGKFDSQTWMLIVGIVAVVGAAAVLAIRLAQRD